MKKLKSLLFVALGEGKVSSKTLADILEPPKLLMTDPREAQP